MHRKIDTKKIRNMKAAEKEAYHAPESEVMLISLEGNLLQMSNPGNYMPGGYDPFNP